MLHRRLSYVNIAAVLFILVWGHDRMQYVYLAMRKIQMNERIKQFAEQATIYIEPTPTSGEGWIFNKEKFAELIVQECIRKVRNRGGMCGALASNWIEEHFYGVEE